MNAAHLFVRAGRMLRLPLTVAVVAAVVAEVALAIKLDRSLRRLDEIPPDTFDD